eukprot:CAMPEP_0182435066 /NCGR_PEP_ID=MMETSP1167-20130531/73519_1 /TAXON_ID=2988 /ORGANISM="Mallomonas Sp, Strain CCMP3275" /LENGTH=458 /DNA_ID=CAMNT_0024625677 /DNA_START=149 /DNA_END=1522 /DNA_ORIENTATION=+
MEKSEESLFEEIKTHPDYVKFVFGDGGPPLPTSKYIYSYPDKEDYQIGILIDPCRNLAYDCCLNYFGTPEYLALRKPGLEPERVIRKNILANDSIISSNGNLVYENGDRVNSPTTSTSTSRMPDDDIVIDSECQGAGDPYQYCVAYHIANVRSIIRPACTDNNNTLDALANCTGLDGNTYPYCVQIGFSQNSFIAQCHPDYLHQDHCGTFLELHLASGSPEYTSETLLSTTKILENSVSGYYTTNISLLWMNDPYKVLCTFAETVIRVGSIVYVKSNAPKCCCPQLRTSSRVGAFLCPIAPSGGGPFAAPFSSITDSLANDGALFQYPFCHGGLETPDMYMCSVYDSVDNVHYTRPCTPVQNTTLNGAQFFVSSEAFMYGTYDSVCPYFPCCGVSKLDICGTGDSPFTFRGRVGRVVSIDDTALITLISVTFNNGRTSYVFRLDQLKLENYMSMYEVW